MTCLDSKDTYKYLGITQLFEPKLRKVKQQLTREYLSRVECIWSSELSAKHKVNSTQHLGGGSIQILFPTIRWYRRPLMNLDKNNRAVLRGYKSQLTHKCSHERMYLPRKKGGRGYKTCAMCGKEKWCRGPILD